MKSKLTLKLLSLSPRWQSLRVDTISASQIRGIMSGGGAQTATNAPRGRHPALGSRRTATGFRQENWASSQHVPIGLVLGLNANPS